jgi:putative redox protein
MEISVESRGDFRLVARIRGHEVVLDQPREGDGTDTGPTPTELFVASLTACVAQYAELYLRRHHNLADGFRVTCSFEMSSDRPPRVARVVMDVPVPEQMDDSAHQALQRVVDHCAVTNTLQHAPSVVVRLVDDEPSPPAPEATDASTVAKVAG